MSRRASNILRDDEARHASSTLRERTGASELHSDNDARKPSSRLNDRASSRLIEAGDTPASMKPSRAERKLPARDRKQLSKKFTKRIAMAAVSTMHSTLDADSNNNDIGQDAAQQTQSVALREGYNTASERARIKKLAKKTGGEPSPSGGTGGAGAEQKAKAPAGASKSRAEATTAKAAKKEAGRAPSGKAARDVADSVAKERARDVTRKTLVRKKMLARNATSTGTKMKTVAKAAARRGAASSVARRSSTVLARAFGGVIVVAATVLPIMAIVLVLATTVGGALAQGGWNMEGLSDNERAVASYFKDKGLEPVQVAAIMGNIARETGKTFDPAIEQNPGGGGGIGLLQWGHLVDGGRGDQMSAWAVSKGAVWHNMHIQLEWCWAEMVNEGSAANQTSWYSPTTSPASFTTFTETTDVAEATRYWYKWMENPGDAGVPAMDERISYARGYLALFRKNASGSADTKAVIDLAYSKLGAPYVFGAAGPNEFDCSGFVKWCMESCGIDLQGARTADQIYRVSTPIDKADALPGDIVVFTYGSPQAGERYGHIGIYLGDGMMIETATPGIGVNVRPIGGGGTYGRL